MKLTNLRKILYPETATSKAEVLDYYARIAPVMLPHLRHRLTTLKRWPDGVQGESLFEKFCPRFGPDWVRTQRRSHEGAKRDIDYCLLDDLPSLIWTASLAALELHVPLATGDNVDRPRTLVFDLDPGAPADVLDCARAALIMRRRLKALGLKSFVKTSGSKGLQLYTPLNPSKRSRLSFEQTKPFAHALARELEDKHPDLIVSKMWKDLRVGKVLIDWSQNHSNKTTICVYSLRGRDRPTVSTPLAWAEVERAVKAEDAEALVFTAEDTLQRVADRGDLFAQVLTLKQSLPELAA